MHGDRQGDARDKKDARESITHGRSDEEGKELHSLPLAPTDRRLVRIISMLTVAAKLKAALGGTATEPLPQAAEKMS